MRDSKRRIWEVYVIPSKEYSGHSYESGLTKKEARKVAYRLHQYSNVVEAFVRRTSGK